MLTKWSSQETKTTRLLDETKIIGTFQHLLLILLSIRKWKKKIRHTAEMNFLKSRIDEFSRLTQRKSNNEPFSLITAYGNVGIPWQYQ